MVNLRIWSSGCHLEALLRSEFFGDGAGVYRQSVVVQNAAQLNDLLRRKVELEQTCQLSVPVLLYYVYAFVRCHKVMNLVREGISPDAHVVHVLAVFFLDLVHAFTQREIGGTVSKETNLRSPILNCNGRRNQFARALKLARQTLHHFLILIRTCLLYTSPSPRDRQKSRM